MEPPEETVGDALLFALDDLSQENFKRFKNKLCSLHVEGEVGGIPWSKLGPADTMDTVRLLLETFGKEGAQEVAVTILRSIHLQDSATRLQKWKRDDCRKKYKRHVQKVLQGVPEMGFQHGPGGRLSQRYTPLLLRRKLDPQETAHEILAMEKKYREIKAPPEVDVENFFEPDDLGRSPKSIVLVGPAGVGKTTLMWKLMLDWASGKCWREKFEYIFCISCRAIESSHGPMSLVDLLLSQSPPGTVLTEGTLMSKDNILILVDGFDALTPGGLPSDGPSRDPHEKQGAATLVMGLLSRRFLARSSLIVSTRPGAVRALLSWLRSPHFVEVMGFLPDQRKEFFHRFFGEEEEATRAFEVVRSHETLFSLCFLPALCWIVCTVFRHESQRDLLKDLPGAATITDTHLHLIFSFLEGRSRLRNLEGLCSLAKDGVLQKTMFFDEGALREHDLSGADLEPLSADGTVLCQNASLAPSYRFIHLSFQEFFAALFYLLGTGGNAETSMRDLKDILGSEKDPSSHYCMVVRFLFGLSNSRRLSALEKFWDCKTARTGLWQELLTWLQQEAKHGAFRKGPQLLELCHCIYEMGDPVFRDSIMGHINYLDLQDQLFTKLDFAALSYCLPGVQTLCSLRLSGYELGPAELKQLLPGLLKASEIQMNRCGLTDAACKGLADVLLANQSLTTLDLCENPLGDSGVAHLHSAWMESRCRLRCLRLQLCNLTAATCEPLALLLASSAGLTELDLGHNRLGNEGVAKLCQGLKHPQSRLQRLVLHHCDLTAAACEALASVLETSETLIDLGLGGNTLGDPAVRQLCTALQRPGCRLQRLAITMGTLNFVTKKKLQAACAVHPQLILTAYYPPGCPAFPGWKSAWL